ncbi:TPA: 50S ribosomal protein L3 [candidate division WOR-3 bacterium]|uniref:Large ribosomal subunit protein uL3 n=1 Tax=candidate division WOR-3 bacterium TaxID=2052148 RepID=A0A350H9X2_UNCW3|nr:50S ribosomal protein L3 [candidate division WOR-3 bacterium]
MKGLIGRKVGMNQMFDDQGNVIPVTIIYMEPNKIIEKKTDEKFGYNALKLGIEEKKESRFNKPELGMFAKLEMKPLSTIKEVRFDKNAIDKTKVGEYIDVTIFEVGARVNVEGTSKGRGFAGWMKRHGFKGGPGSHGSHEVHRRPGSIGANTFPGRVILGKRMAGHFGNERVTTLNIKIVKVDKEKNLLIVKGAVPGAMNSLVIVKQA